MSRYYEHGIFNMTKTATTKKKPRQETPCDLHRNSTSFSIKLTVSHFGALIRSFRKTAPVASKQWIVKCFVSMGEVSQGSEFPQQWKVKRKFGGLRNSRFGDDRVGSQIQTKKKCNFCLLPCDFCRTGTCSSIGGLLNKPLMPLQGKAISWIRQNS